MRTLNDYFLTILPLSGTTTKVDDAVDTSGIADVKK